jgi:CHAD domain-containing protein
MQLTKGWMMFEFDTPLSLFRTQIETIRSCVPGVLDGEAGAIHDSRIATRRIRELLPLLTRRDQQLKRADDLHRRFTRLGRSLGRVRDADVRLALLSSLETRIPHAAPQLVVLRQRRERERLQLLRKLIKRLERLEAPRFIEALGQQKSAWPGRFCIKLRPTWKQEIYATVNHRAKDTAAAMAHATGVYFPERLHAGRIAIKKLRYAMEIVNDSGAADRRSAIQELKKAQDLLGEIHDRQELIDHLAEADSSNPEGDDGVALLRQVIDAEIHELHARYLARRENLLKICREQRPATRRAALTPGMVAVGAMALSSGVLAFRVTKNLHDVVD